MKKVYIATAVGVGVTLLAGLSYAFRYPLWHLFVSAPPPIIASMQTADWTNDKTFTAAVVRTFPPTATEAGLVRELTREHFVVHQRNHKADYYWTEPVSENWFLLEWQVSGGRVTRITHNWQCGC